MGKNTLLMGIISLLFFSGVAHADRTVWYVHPDSALNSIQAALDSCTDNDIVLVGPGLYYENIVWNNTQGIHLVSELGPDTTIIDGGNAGCVIEITTGVDTTTVIRGFTIQNGNGWQGGIFCFLSSPVVTGNIIVGNDGPGIYCDYVASPIIKDNIISNNHTTFAGGGIFCERDGSPFIIGNTISDNRASIHGGGIACDDFYGGHPFISGNTITNNRTDYNNGGGIFVRGGATLHNNIITYNSAELGRGGGIFFAHGGYAAQSTNNTISNNTAQIGGGIYIDHRVSITNDTIIDNIASMNGGGIYRGGSSAIITGSIVTGNTADSGGGIYYRHTGTRDTIRTTLIANNTANLEAAGIFCGYNASPIIDSCTISNNNGNGIYNDGNASPVIRYTNIINNAGYGVKNGYNGYPYLSAEYNWWGDASGPYHPDSNPGGLGDTVSDYVDFIPWLDQPVGVWEKPIVNLVNKHTTIGSTIFSGPLVLPMDKTYRVLDITGRVVAPDKIKPGIYFIEIDGAISHKVSKIK